MYPTPIAAELIRQTTAAAISAPALEQVVDRCRDDGLFVPALQLLEILLRQTRERCGPAALEMVLGYYGAGSVARAEAERAFDPALGGTLVTDLASAARRAVILVDAAGNFRGFSPMPQLAEALSQRFTVFTYDRRGKGASTDTLPYAVDREIDDLQALIDLAGGSAFVHGFSSGAILGLLAAEHGIGIAKVSLLEPPLRVEATPPPLSGISGEVARLVITGRLVATFTNPANGVSLTENISGPAQIDFVRGTAFGDGPGAGPVPALGSGIWLGFGRFDFVTGQTVGHFIPLCPPLAGT